MTATPDAAPAAELSLPDGRLKLKRFAQLSARRARIEADLAAKITPIKAAADKKLAPIAAELATLRSELKPWWARFAEQLTGGKTKSAEVAGCVIGTKLSPAQLLFTKGDEKVAVLTLLKGRFLKLLRRPISLDKKAIADRLKAEGDQGEIAKLGFKLHQDEAFFIEPAVHAGRKA